jgi:hypothetical protein
MNIVDKYSKRPISNQQTLEEYIADSTNFDDIPVVASRNATREATIEAVKGMVSKL